MNDIVLFSYFRSSASYRVRAALNLKKLKFSTQAVNLKSGEHFLPELCKISDFSELPVLVHQGNPVAQSMAIILYLEDAFPETLKLFPKLSYDKAIVIQMCEVINSGIHPVQNLKVGKKLKKDHSFTQGDVFNWNKYWIELGFDNFEKMLSKFCGEHCFGNALSAADLFLVPQVYNALRFKVNLDDYKNIQRIYKNNLNINEIILAGPEYQPDTPDEFKLL